MKLNCKLLTKSVGILTIIVCISRGVGAASNRTQIQDIMAVLTPEQKVGQLFLVGFDGIDISNETSIHKLIYDYRVGGAMLMAENDNFTDKDDMVLSTSKLTKGLQRIAWQKVNQESQEAIGMPSTGNSSSGYLPLLIGTKYNQNLGENINTGGGFTRMPGPMAVGATWDTNLALSMGEIAGSELSALGINLYVGPRLDVADSRVGTSTGGTGLDTFGGNPYWVGKMIRSFIVGVHRGSSGRIAFVGESFPGLGGADSGSGMDVPVVNKPLQELVAIDLAPYRTVTKLPYGSEETIDVLMPAQARYSAWQGSLSIDTRPFGLDSGAMAELFNMQEFYDWREQGGLIMSSALGREGVRRFYDPTDKTFPAFEIARDAFLAGNDILFLDDFVFDRSEDQFATVVSTIELFVRKYREDTAFAERVDSAVERIIAIKLRLYDKDMSIINVTEGSLLFGVEIEEGKVFQVAQKAVTLLSPSKAEFVSRVPRGPSALDRIVIFTDSRTFSTCSICKEQVRPPVQSLEKAIERLYGFGGISQNSTLELFSFSLADLTKYVADVNISSDESSLANSDRTNGDDSLSDSQISSEIESALVGADWLVFAVGEPEKGVDRSALDLLLTERPDLLSDKKVIVFATGAPYYLDATAVSQFTAYYGLYGDSSPFIEVAARVLFQEIVPHEAPPISIDAVSYDLQANLSPDPTQTFVVVPIVDIGEADIADNALVNNSSDESADSISGLPTPDAVVKEIMQGSTVNLQTSKLVDHNLKNVPDGTIVEFDASYLAEGGITETFAVAKTVAGVANGTLVVDRMGLVEIRARSGDAISDALQFDVLLDSDNLADDDALKSEGTLEVAILETTSPTEATSTSDILTEVVVVNTAVPDSVREVITVIDNNDALEDSVHIDPRDLMSAILAMIVISAIGWSVASMRGMAPLLKSRVRLILFVTVGVWTGYDYYALKLPVPELLLNFVGLAPALLAWAGGFVGLLVGTITPGELSFDSIRSRMLGSKRSDDS